MKRDLNFEATYPYPAERVWRALTDREALAQWLMPNDFEPRLGHKFQFRTTPGPGWDGVVNCEVLEIDRPRRLSYSWRGGPLDTVVTFILEPQGQSTRLRLEHTGFAGAGGTLVSIIMGNGWKKMVERKIPAVIAAFDSGAPPAVECEDDPSRFVLSRYEAGTQLLSEALAAIPRNELDRSPAPGQWNARQIALHIVDAEIVGAARLRMLAAEPGSTLKAYAGDVWGARLGYDKLSLEPALELFVALRRCTSEMLRGLPREAWSNRGVHEGSGEVTLESYLLAHCEHAEAHVDEILALSSPVAAGAAPK